MKRFLRAFLVPFFFQVNVHAQGQKSCGSELSLVQSFAEKNSGEDRHLSSFMASLHDLISDRDLGISRRVRKRWLEAHNHLEKDFANEKLNPHSHQALLKQRFPALIKGLIETARFLNAQNPSSERAYYQSIFHAALAFATVHSHEIMDMKNPSQINFSRYLKIMKSISSFNGNQAEYSLYSIKKAIEEEFSLREFTHCKL